MTKRTYISLFIGIIVSAALAVSPGCNVAGVLVNESPHERMRPAEYDLKKQLDGSLLVFVEGTRANRLAAEITVLTEETMATYLEERVGIPAEKIKLYSETTLLTEESLIRTAVPEVVAADVGAQMVLYVLVMNTELVPLGHEEYVSGSMYSRALLLQAATGDVIWPKDKDGLAIDLEFDLETEGRQPALLRLATATAHCIGRNLYKIRNNQYRNKDEKVPYTWE